ncbi:MAG: hypothetical protein WCD44_02035 [Candidatus Babeliales bacterium]
MDKYFLKYKFAALFALLPIASMAGLNTNNQIEYTEEHTDLVEFCHFIHHMVGNLDAFLDKNNNESYTKHVKHFARTIEKYSPDNNNTFRSGFQSDVAIKIRCIREEFSQPFLNIQKVLKKYQGRDRNSANELIRDLRETLPFQQLFTKLKTELLTLEKEALIQNDKKLIHMIKRFIHYIDQKKIDWNKKSPLVLFSTLCRRMNIR